MNLINKPIYVGITGIGKTHGEIPIDNIEMCRLIEIAVRAKISRLKEQPKDEELDKLLAENLTTPEWIENRTGIKMRYFSSKPTSELAVPAVEQALNMAGLSRESIDAIIFATVSPDYKYSPPTASMLHKHLGLHVSESIEEKLRLKNCITFDISNACTSFGSGLLQAYSLIMSGVAKHVLVIGADRMSTTVDMADRAFSILLGDAAAAVVMEAVEQDCRNSFPYGSAGFISGTDPAGALNIVAREGGSCTPLSLESLQLAENEMTKFRPDKLSQDGKKVFKEIINLMMGAWVPKEKTIIGRLVEATGLQLSDIDIAFFHQANLRINSDIEERMIQKGLKPDTVYNTINEVGNTTSAAIPYGMCHAYESGRLKTGMTVLIAAFGGGYTWMLVPVLWTLTEPC